MNTQPFGLRAHADGTATVDQGVVPDHVVGGLDGDDLVLAAATLQEVVLDDREGALPRGTEVIAASADGLAPVLAVRVNHITKMVVVHAVALGADQGGVIPADEERTAAVDLALKEIVINAPE